MGVIARIRGNAATENTEADAQQLLLQAELENLRAELDSVKASFGRITFSPEGTILDANDLFLSAVGYRLDEITGRHHRLFVDPAEANSGEYARFWDALRQGQSQDAQFRRLANGGREFYIQASYMPVRDSSGRVISIVKYCTDITDETRARTVDEAKLEAISRSQAVIEFDVRGNVINANENFLRATGYRTVEEIRGKHHRLFVDSDYAESPEYRQFWATLERGDYLSGKFKRVKKNGDELWLEASYNPILDTQGRPTGVVKFASDITAMMEVKQRSSEAGNAVVESVSQMSDTILEISENLNRTAGLASETEALSSRTGESVERLTECSKVIEDIVEAIRTLADQTRMLAINATIESARAGEAGRSFAVVAGEVKDLARQTADATNNIVNSVANIRSSIAEVAESTGHINGSISEVSANMTNIAAAVEEQSVSTNDMKRSATELLDSLE